MPEPGWDLEEDRSACMFLSIAHNFNPDPMSFPECHKALDFITWDLDPSRNQRKVVMQDWRAERIREEECQANSISSLVAHPGWVR